MNVLKKGDRVRYSSVGLKAIGYKNPNRAGVVITIKPIDRWGTECATVRWDETKTPQSIAMLYVEKAIS